MSFLFTIFLVIAICVFIISIISWKVHGSMTKDNSAFWNYGNFKKFVSEFNKIKWDDDKPNVWPNSFFDSKTDSEIHASIFKFNGNGMVLGPIDFLRASIFLKSKASKREGYDGRKPDLWN